MECQHVQFPESLNEKCLAPEAEGLELDTKSIFTEDTKPAAKPEPGEIVEDTKSTAETGSNTMYIADSGVSKHMTMYDYLIPCHYAKSSL